MSSGDLRHDSDTPPPRELASLRVPLLALLGVVLLVAVMLGIHQIGVARHEALDKDLPPAPPTLDDAAAFEAALAARRPPVPQLLRGATHAAVAGAPAPGTSFDPLALPETPAP